MTLFEKIKRHIEWRIKKTGIYDNLSDEKYLKMLFKKRFGKELDLNNPQTFNEKLQWLKLYDRKPIYTTMVDKYEVKEFVSNIIGKDYSIPTIGVWNTFDEIDFDKLPNQFVLKCTHDSGGLVIVKDKQKFNKTKAKEKISQCLKRNYYVRSREWPYKEVKPRIIAEPYMVDGMLGELRDYKFFCFNGKCRCFKIDYGRFIKHQANYYDRNGCLLKFGEIVCPPDFGKHIELPKNLNNMVEIAEQLSKDMIFLRVDFYEVNGKVYVGELTFYPASGMGKFEPEEWDNTLGSWLVLPVNFS